MPNEKNQILYQCLAGAFCTIVLISNILSAKMVKLPYLDNFLIPAGLIFYPLTFLLSDLITEIFGLQRAKLTIYTALGLNLLSYAIIQLVLFMPTATLKEESAFQAILGLSSLRIFSSLVAFISAQIIDIQLYAMIKRWTGGRFLWMRSNGSTWVAQIVDTIAIDILYLYFGLHMPLSQVVPIMLFSFAYKALFSIAGTPLFYLAVSFIRKRRMLDT